MTSEIEGMQGDNGPSVEVGKAEIEDYEPMRHDDPHQGEGGEPVALGGDEQPDPETAALLEEASDLVIEAIERRAEPDYTPVPATETFLVHDDDTDPRRAKNVPTTPDPHELMFLGVQEHVRSMVALNTLDAALRWAGGYANRKVFPVRSITLGQPLMGVIIPERRVLMSEEEAAQMGREDSDD